MWRRPLPADDPVALPAEVQRLLVDSLFRDSRSLAIGAVTTVVAIVVTAAKTQSLPILASAVALAGVAFARLQLIRRYEAARALPSSPEDSARWETGYSIGAGVHGFVLGLWCLLCLTFTHDGFAQLLSAVVTIGVASAIPGRNFGRVGLATLQIVCLCVPLCIGWLLQGNWYYGFLTAVTLPFFAALRIMSVRLQGMLLEALSANNKLGALAERFDAALTNMPHGLCMLDRRGRVLVFNARFVDVMGLASTSDLQGAELSACLARETGTETVNAPLDRQIDKIDALLASHARGNVSVRLGDGRTVTLTLQPMRNGGAVLVAEDITERKLSENKIVRLARFDTVTEVANRAWFQEQMATRLADAERRGESCALLFVDLDRFKLVNDTMGHVAGDLLLRDVARRLSGLLSGTDVIGRFGGDEFVILQAAITGNQEVVELATKIIQAIARPFLLNGQTVKIAISVGIALAPEHCSEPALLLQRADLALYRAKTAGRGRWCFFEPAMDLEALQRRALEIDLAAAVETWAFHLNFQPLVRLDTMGIETCEALLRWQHPKRGMVSPAEFIPVAEELGLIVEIGTQVLRLACEQCQTWPNETRVAVNLSSLQFERSDIVAVIREALTTSGLAPHRLEVEITETMLLQNTKSTREALERIRDLGVGVVLDDFGTGHSNLSYLQSFPLKKIKLDRSFLRDVLDNERSYILLDSLGEMSQRLGLSVVIEGIETEAQLNLVMGLSHVDEAQGFLLGRPVSAEMIADVLSKAATRGSPQLGRPRKAAAQRRAATARLERVQ